jgi:phage terminase small subunit
MKRRNVLTVKQQKFVQEYVKDGNASRAVKEAYPNINTNGARRTMGAKLVTKDNIQERIQEILDKAGLTPELLAKELRNLIEGDDKSQKNKAIRTTAEIMGLIGRSGIVATQVNVGQSSFTDQEKEEIKAIKGRIIKNKEHG